MGRNRIDQGTTTRAGLAFRWPDLAFVVTLGWMAVALVLTVTNRRAAGGIDPFALVGGPGLAATSTIGWVILRRTGLAPSYVPPISVMLARHKDTYIRGLTSFREGDLEGWLAIFADAAGSAAQLAQHYVRRVMELQERWRGLLRAMASPPRADAAAWVIIDVLPAHPVITTSIAIAATGRTRPAIVNAVQQLLDAGVLLPLSESGKNKAWEAGGLLELIVGLEEGSAV